MGERERDRETGRYLPRAGKRAPGSVESAGRAFDNARCVPIMGQAVLREQNRDAPSRETCTIVAEVGGKCKK